MNEQTHEWHVEHAEPLSDGAALNRGTLVRWQTQIVECCGRRIIVADERPAVWINDPHGLTGRTVQCNGCGSLYTAEFEIA